MIGEGVMILAIGMGMVFLFFIVLIAVMKLIEVAIGSLSQRFPEKKLTSQTAVPMVDEGAHIAVAIAVAKQRVVSVG